MNLYIVNSRTSLTVILNLGQTTANWQLGAFEKYYLIFFRNFKRNFDGKYFSVFESFLDITSLLKRKKYINV